MKRNLQQWLELLEQRQSAKIKLGLERISNVKQQMGINLDMPLFMVGGTNGKGSVVAYLESFFRLAGYRTGSFFSPHLFSFAERIQVNGNNVKEDELCSVFEEIESADSAANSEPLTYFEFVTLAAAIVYRNVDCEVAIMEVGLGGRLDAINCFDCDVAVISSIGIDHVQHLGSSRESIGKEKAGIFRSGHPVICGDAQPPASIAEAAEKLGAPLFVRDRDYSVQINQTDWVYQGKGLRSALPAPVMQGKHQVNNAATALCALEQVEQTLPVSQAIVREALLTTKLPGRFEIIDDGQIPVILDVAHNVDSAVILNDNLLMMGYFERTIAVYSSHSRKDVKGIVEAISNRIDEWHIAPLVGEEARVTKTIVEGIIAKGGIAHYWPNIAAAAAAAHISAGVGARIVIFGSFDTVIEYCQVNMVSDKDTNEVSTG